MLKKYEIEVLMQGIEEENRGFRIHAAMPNETLLLLAQLPLLKGIDYEITLSALKKLANFWINYFYYDKEAAIELYKRVR